MNDQHTSIDDMAAPWRSRLPAMPTPVAVSLALLLGLGAGLGGAVLAQPGKPPAVSPVPTEAVSQPLAQLPSFADVVERVSPAVVNVKVTGDAGAAPFFGGLPEDMPLPEFFRRFFEDLPRGHGGPLQGAPRRIEGQGSGFIISDDGYIVTNDHVIDHATEVNVVLNDGRSFSAKVVGRDDKSDLALLKIEAEQPLAYVELGDSSKARVGDWVLAVGNPFGLGGSVNAGIISARGRDIHNGPYDDYLQIDAAINRGNSGGPLFDASGRVIGVNTAIYSPSGGNVGIGFAIPTETVRTVVNELKQKGRVDRGWLGIHIQAVTDELATGLGLPDDQGVLVVDILPNAPVVGSGLRAGDVILRANGRSLKTYRDLPRIVAATPAGSEMSLEVVRDGKTLPLKVKVGKMPGSEAGALTQNGQPSGQAELGMTLAPLTPEMIQRRGLAADAEGVMVVQVRPDSPAAQAGIVPGTLITMVSGQTVSTPDAVRAGIDAATTARQKSLVMRIEQSGNALFVAVPLSQTK